MTKWKQNVWKKRKYNFDISIVLLCVLNTLFSLVPTNAAYLLLYFMEFEATTKVREQLHNTDKMLYLARA